jgi:hypothetical protein
MSDFCKLREVHDKAIVYIAPDFSPVLRARSKECPWNVVIIDALDRSAKKCNKCHFETCSRNSLLRNLLVGYKIDRNTDFSLRCQAGSLQTIFFLSEEIFPALA